MKLLVDMNLSPRWVGFLERSGWQAVHWAMVGRADASDAEIMAFAVRHGFVVLTHDLDFSAILAATRGGKPSVVQIRSDSVDPDRIGAPVLAALRQMHAELAAGALLSVDPGRTRLRLLPLPGKPTDGAD